MNLRKGIKVLVLSLLISIAWSSCCNSDCFDDLTGAVELKLFFSGDDTINHFNPNRLDLLDSIYLIKTTQGNINEHLDTIYHFEKEYFNRTNVFLLSSDAGFDYIFGNRDPYFRAEITDFHSEVENPKGRCNCAEAKSFRITVDGTQQRGLNPAPIWIKK